MSERTPDTISGPAANLGPGELNRLVHRAVALTEELNQVPYAHKEEIRRLWTELTGQEVDESFILIPPFFSEHGLNIRVGNKVFINQGCTLMDLGGIEIGDEVMVGPKVNLITAGHALAPSDRRRHITAAPIVIERGAWIGAGATILQGVTIGEDAVVAAGAVVTRSVPPLTLVAGVPAKPIRTIEHGESDPDR